MTMEDIRLEGKAGRLGATMTAVVVDGPNGKEYRLPTDDEIRLAAEAAREVERVFAEISFGIPDEPTPKGGSGAARAFSVDGYGFDRWSKLFTPRQIFALGTFVKHTRAVPQAMGRYVRTPSSLRRFADTSLFASIELQTDRVRSVTGIRAMRK